MTLYPDTQILLVLAAMQMEMIMFSPGAAASFSVFVPLWQDKIISDVIPMPLFSGKHVFPLMTC